MAGKRIAKLPSKKLPSKTTASGLLDGLISRKDTAAELGVCEKTVISLERRGLLVRAPYGGREPYYVIAASNRRLRGERDPAPRRRRRPAEEMTREG